MRKLIFATNNKNKLFEIELMLSDKYSLSTPLDFGITEDIPEEQPTIEGNASQKAHYIFDKVGVDCFADDTGLEVDALGGEPGVFSARYAGEQKKSEDNISLLLTNMKGKENRKARFRTVISLIIKSEEHLFEGIVEGTIIDECRGIDGFGYDPVFVPDGYDITFAEMDIAEKNKISHRAIAVAKLIYFLSGSYNNR